MKKRTMKRMPLNDEYTVILKGTYMVDAENEEEAKKIIEKQANKFITKPGYTSIEVRKNA